MNLTKFGLFLSVCAIDGKHVRIVVRARSSGTLYHNYKRFFSFYCRELDIVEQLQTILHRFVRSTRVYSYTFVKKKFDSICDVKHSILQKRSKIS